MRHWLIATLLALGAISNTFAATFTVNIPVGTTTFSPSSVNIEVGDTVTWVNPAGGFNHGVRTDDGTTVNFPVTAAPWTNSHTFTTAGKFPYYCPLHGAAGGVGMSGVVFVRATHAANEHILQLNAWDLQPVITGTTTGSVASFFRTITGGTPVLIAGVNLPTGTTITGIEMVACDNDAANEITVNLERCAEPGTTCTTVATASTSGTPGCGFFSSPAITESVQNLNNAYFVTAFETSQTLNIQLRTVRIYYKLAISPAPQTATFTDVPTTHPFFRFVEALYASGLSGGCGGGNFCPDTPVTRGQMAVFLAGALGLFWPN
jgi:plastocyanin